MKKLNQFLQEEKKLFLKSIKWHHRSESETNLVHHHLTLHTSKYFESFTDIHYCSISNDYLTPNENQRPYVYYDNGDGKYFSFLSDAKKEVIRIKWLEKKKELKKLHKKWYKNQGSK